MPAVDATERIDMRHSMAGEWRFHYALENQATPLDAPVPVDIFATRSYESRWLEAKGSDVVVASATIVADGQGGVVAVVDESAVASAGVGDHWWYLLENNAGDVTVIAHGVVTVEDDT